MRVPVMVLCALGPLLAPSPGRAADPQIEYMLNCMGCHQADGAGVPRKVPDMRFSLGPLSQTSAGRRYLIEVPGVAQAPLSNADLAGLLNWLIRAFADARRSQHFVAFTAAEVAAYRKTPLVEVAAIRRKLLAVAARRTPDAP